MKEIKSTIVRTQSRVVANANAEMLSLYFGIGRYVSNKTKTEKWGTGVIDTISAQLQKEMPGLLGFSGKSIRKMRQFFEIWNEGAIWPTASAKLDEKNGMGENHSSQPINLEEAVIWPTMPAKLESGNPTSAATIEFFSMSQREDGHDAAQRATPRYPRTVVSCTACDGGGAVATSVSRLIHSQRSTHDSSKRKGFRFSFFSTRNAQLIQS